MDGSKFSISNQVEELLVWESWRTGPFQFAIDDWTLVSFEEKGIETPQ